MPKIEMTNMCMIYDKEANKVLVQDRLKSWKGICFSGGKVEDSESIVESTIREVKEETGLDVSNLKPCGVVHWHNIDTGDKYFVFNYKTSTFTGDLLNETDEGKVFWVDFDELTSLEFASGFRERLPMFLKEQYNEHFGKYSNGEFVETTLL